MCRFFVYILVFSSVLKEFVPFFSSFIAQRTSPQKIATLLHSIEMNKKQLELPYLFPFMYSCIAYFHFFATGFI